MKTTLPMTAGQQGLWYLARTGDDACAAYNVVVALRATSALDAAALESAVDRALLRHPTVAARVVLEDHVPHLECDSALRAPIRRFTGSVQACAQTESEQAIDMVAGPLYRLCVVDDEHACACGVVLTVHHLVFDGASVAILLDEIARCHQPAAGDAVLPSWSLQAHVDQETAFLQSPQGRAQVADIAQTLAEMPTGDALPTRAAAGSRALGKAGQCAVPLEPKTSRAARALASRMGTTPAAVYLATMAVLVWQHGQRRELLISLPLDVRDPEAMGEVGYLMNVGILRIGIDAAATVETLVDQVSDRLFELLENRQVPYPVLVRALKGRREDLAAALLRLAFKYEWKSSPEWRFGQATLHPVPVAGRYAKSLLKLEIEDSDLGGHCVFDYDADAIDDGIAQRMSVHYELLLAAMLDAPSRCVVDLPVLGAEEQARLIGHATPASPSTPVEVRVAAHARLQPDADAIVCGPLRLSYSELEARAERLAGRLRGRGVGPDARVAMCLGRDVERVVAMLAIAKAGGACLPMDPEAPDGRLHFMLDDSSAKVLLCRGTDAARFSTTHVQVVCIDAQDDVVPELVVGEAALPGHLAYCIYTSGSTGRPKGVDVPRSALANLVEWHIDTARLGPGDRFLQVTNVAFDPATWETWGALCAGATLVLAQEFVADPAEIASILAKEGITQTCLVTPLAEAFMASTGAVPLPLKMLHTGGDRLHFGIPDDRFELVNHYGPTECTVISTSARVRAGLATAPTIGRPISNVRSYVLDLELRPVPPGTPGRLYIAGAGIARGYCGQPALTAERFMPDPFGEPGSRMYDTGDLAQWRADGELDFIGRVDGQIKWRGYRIEPGEIESVLHETGLVSEAVVALQQDAQGNSHLVACVVPASAVMEVDTGALSRVIRESLPHYMVPSAWLCLPRLPRGSTGKVDRNALPTVPLKSDHDAAPVTPPASTTERWLLEVWQDVLRVPGLRSTDNFFALGGHSLLATQIVAKASSQLGRPVPLRLLLDFPTVASLAERLDALPIPEAPAATQPGIVRRPRAVVSRA
jgi:amino acid adenylation domain-containing protein